ncbi:MAG: hypothetical protein HXY28_05825 [Hydrogenophilaceae bacterium]|nr:hypothetical protein [Hydrogenophilaceae bacterium]
MSVWSLSRVLASVHDDIERRLSTVRASLAHTPTKGDASESVWRELLETYLPARYRVASAHVVDSEDHFSQQLDVVIFDRQFSPFILQYEGATILPAESVYAAFEAKQTASAANIAYAAQKIASVRALHRTTLPIPHAGGMYPPRELPRILGGILALDSEWSPPLSEPLRASLQGCPPEGGLDLGCVAAHGWFSTTTEGDIALNDCTKPTTAFLFELIARLQAHATVPMIDIRAYAKWLA